MGFFDRGFEEDENALGLGLWWPGPEERVPSSVRTAALQIRNWLPALQTCKWSVMNLLRFDCALDRGRLISTSARGLLIPRICMRDI